MSVYLMHMHMHICVHVISRDASDSAASVGAPSVPPQSRWPYPTGPKPGQCRVSLPGQCRTRLPAGWRCRSASCTLTSMRVYLCARPCVCVCVWLHAWRTHNAAPPNSPYRSPDATCARYPCRPNRDSHVSVSVLVLSGALSRACASLRCTALTAARRSNAARSSRRATARLRRPPQTRAPTCTHTHSRARTHALTLWHAQTHTHAGARARARTNSMKPSA
jgi:hypothetical protein